MVTGHGFVNGPEPLGRGWLGWHGPCDADIGGGVATDQGLALGGRGLLDAVVTEHYVIPISGVRISIGAWATGTPLCDAMRR